MPWARWRECEPCCKLLQARLKAGASAPAKPSGQREAAAGQGGATADSVQPAAAKASEADAAQPAAEAGAAAGATAAQPAAGASGSAAADAEQPAAAAADPFGLDAVLEQHKAQQKARQAAAAWSPGVRLLTVISKAHWKSAMGVCALRIVLRPPSKVVWTPCWVAALSIVRVLQACQVLAAFLRRVHCRR